METAQPVKTPIREFCWEGEHGSVGGNVDLCDFLRKEIVEYVLMRMEMF